jgi:hypothetical protein
MAMQPSAGDEISAEGRLPPTPKTEGHHPRVRQRITTWLLVILALQIVAAVVLVFYPWEGSPQGQATTTTTPMKERLDALKDLLAITFGPSVTLLGSAIGFYFGERTTRPSD